MEGTVKFFNRKKGFGFISGEDGKDYFVHFTALPRGAYLHDNDKVSFNSAEGDRGLKAENVQILQKAAPSADEGHSSHKSHGDDDEDSDDEDADA